MHNQVREICTNYGKLDVLWFDFSYDTLRGEAWKATELINMVRKLQPDVIIDNRLEVSGEGYGSLAAGNPTSYHGDFVSPEQMIPPNGIQDVKRYRLGILRHDEQSLGLLCQRPLLQTGTDADQKAGRVRIEGWKPAFECRPGRQGKYPGGVDRTAG